MDYYETQAFLMRNTPGLSLADDDFISGWVERTRAGDRTRVTTWAVERRARNKTKARQVLERVDALQDAMVDVRKGAERNEAAWGDFAKRQRRLASERIALEKLLESLQSSEASITAMEDDPTAYLSSFYGRFPTLADSRPNLAKDLAEDQRKRGGPSHLVNETRSGTRRIGFIVQKR